MKILKLPNLILLYWIDSDRCVNIETIVRKGENQIHSVKPSELHTEGSDDSNKESVLEVHQSQRLLNVIYANGDYFIY